MARNPERRSFRGRSYKKGGAPLAEVRERSLGEIKAIVKENYAHPERGTYEGLESSEIGRYNRALMFGDNDEAFPSPEEWSRIVD